MAFRRRTSVRRGPRKRAVWVNIPFGAVAFSETAGRQILLVPEDWEASFTGLTNEHAVLRACVGELVFSQNVVGTAGNNFFWGIYAHGIGAAVPVFTTTGMSDVSWLRVGARATTASVTSSVLQSTSLSSQGIDIKSKRKLDTTMQISIVAQYSSEAAAPNGVMSGILRFLVARD